MEESRPVDAAPAATAAASHEGEVDPLYAPLHARIEEAMERLRVPGVAVGMLLDGTKEHVAGFGVTNITAPCPVSADTLFQIGSITKTVTTTALLRLAERGAVELDAPVRTYLPDLRLADSDAAAGVTLRHLLTHTAGWDGDFLIFEDTGRGDDALASFIARMGDIPQLTPLGTVWSYNNAGFSLAGRVIEAVTGQTYERAATELVLAPLGMERSFFFPEEVMLHRFAVGHIVAGDVSKVARPWPIPRGANPAGGISSCPADLLRYARFQMGDGTSADGTQLLSRATLDEMQTPRLEARAGQQMGLAWFIQDMEGVRLLSHGGGTNGQLSFFVYAPQRQFAFVVLTNALRGGELATEVTNWALEHYLGIAEPKLTHLERSADELGEYAGRYTATLNICELSVRDGVLMLQAIPTGAGLGDEPPPPPPPSPVAFYEPDKIVALEGQLKDVRGEFLRGPDGGLVWLRISGRLHRRA